MVAIRICIWRRSTMNKLKQIIELDCPQWHLQRKRVFSVGGGSAYVKRNWQRRQY